MNFKPIFAKPKGIIVFLIFFCFSIIFGLSITFIYEKEIRIFLFFFILFIVGSIYFLIKRLSFFKIEKEYFKNGFIKYNYNEIKNITLYDYKTSKFLFLPVSEKGLSITLKNDNKVFLLDDYLNNLWEIRWFLENKIIKKNKLFLLDFNLNFFGNEMTNKTTPISNLTKSIPYIFYSLLVILLISIVALFIDIDLYPEILVFSSLGTLFMVVMFMNSCYIESCDQGLIVKNLIFKHLNKRINLKLIESIRLRSVISKRKSTFLIIKMIYHKEFKFGIDAINYERTENIIAQIHKLNIPFYDSRN